MSQNKIELIERINFWRKNNNENEIEKSLLSNFSDFVLESILKMQYTIFINRESYK